MESLILLLYLSLCSLWYLINLFCISFFPSWSVNLYVYMSDFASVCLCLPLALPLVLTLCPYFSLDTLSFYPFVLLSIYLILIPFPSPLPFSLQHLFLSSHNPFSFCTFSSITVHIQVMLLKHLM